MKDDHCCDEMSFFLEQVDVPVTYKPATRSYGIEYQDGGSSIQEISFCPWCGTSLPKPLTCEWLREVRQAGFEDDAWSPDLPERLQTDAWWREDARYAAGAGGLSRFDPWPDDDDV